MVGCGGDVGTRRDRMFDEHASRGIIQRFADARRQRSGVGSGADGGNEMLDAVLHQALEHVRPSECSCATLGRSLEGTVDERLPLGARPDPTRSRDDARVQWVARSRTDSLWLGRSRGP